MKTKVAILAAAALAFATLPSCVPAGSSIDPAVVGIVGELGDSYIGYERMRAEQDAAQYQRYLDAQAIKQQQAAAAAQAQWQTQTQMQPVSPFVYPAPVVNY